jgi:hypothetical protein
VERRTVTRRVGLCPRLFSSGGKRFFAGKRVCFEVELDVEAASGGAREEVPEEQHRWPQVVQDESSTATDAIAAAVGVVASRR